MHHEQLHSFWQSTNKKCRIKVPGSIATTKGKTNLENQLPKRGPHKEREPKKAQQEQRENRKKHLDTWTTHPSNLEDCQQETSAQ